MHADYIPVGTVAASGSIQMQLIYALHQLEYQFLKKASSAEV